MELRAGDLVELGAGGLYIQPGSIRQETLEL